MITDPRVNRTVTYATHQRRAVEPDGTTHGARYAGDRQHFTLACAVYPMPTIERLEHQELTDTEFWPVTCPGCKAAMAVVITCPLCKTPGAEEFGLPIPDTDDSADCARCINPECGIHWGLDPAANGACTQCGGSGHTGRGTYRDPRCACTEEAEEATVVVLCGSTRFMAEMTEANVRETAAGRIVLAPGCDLKTPHPLWADPADAEALKARLDALHRAKIRMADEVLVVGDYIGDSTRAEIEYARQLGKPVRYTHPEVEETVK